MLLSYLANLSLLILKKSSGETIQDDPVLMRLVEIRTVSTCSLNISILLGEWTIACRLGNILQPSFPDP